MYSQVLALGAAVIDSQAMAAAAHTDFATLNAQRRNLRPYILGGAQRMQLGAVQP